MSKWFIFNLPNIEGGESLHGKGELIKHVLDTMVNLKWDLRSKSGHKLFPVYFEMLTDPAYPYLTILKKYLTVFNHFKVDLRKDNLNQMISIFLGISSEQADSLIGIDKKKSNFKYFLFQNERFEIYLTTKGNLLDIICHDKEKGKTKGILNVEEFTDNKSDSIHTTLSKIIAKAIFQQARSSKDTHHLTSACGSISQATTMIHEDLKLHPCAINRSYAIPLHNCTDLGTVTVCTSEITYQLLIEVFGEELGVKSVEDLKKLMLIHNFRLGFENLDIGPEEIVSDLTF